MDKKLILDHRSIEQIIRRIAYQIYENNIDASAIGLVGIEKQGIALAGLIREELSLIDSQLRIPSFEVKLDKKNPLGSVTLKGNLDELEASPVVIIDDVLNSGKTIAFSLMALLETKIAKAEVAVLVDRGHRLYPVSATYSGIQLSTTLEEHIEVKFGKKPVVHLY